MATYQLSFDNLRVWVSLGCTPEERAQFQAVDIGIQLNFKTLPKACHSDKLSETICYAELITAIQTLCANQAFQLIEHLAYCVHKQIIPFLNDQINVAVKVIKIAPPVAGMNCPVSFIYAP